MAHILVTGAAGLLGRNVCDALRSRGAYVTGLVRQVPDAPTPQVAWAQADLLRADTLSASIFDGLDAIIHCATNSIVPAEDVRAIGNILRAARHVPHVVYVGIAGIEAAAGALAYYQAKLDCEAALLASGQPHTIARATQFHDLIDYVVSSLCKGSFLLCPRLTFQPVDVRFVAERLADLALAAPIGRARDIHGPETLTFDALSRAWLQAHHTTKLRIPIPALGLLRGFSRLARVDGDAGGLQWSAWLAARASVASRPS